MEFRSFQQFFLVVLVNEIFHAKAYIFDDVNKCLSNPCQNQGTCVEQLEGYICLCKPGFTGDECAVNVMECQSDPCMNGVCVDLVNGYMCRCNNGYEGKRCQTKIDYCARYPCVYGECVTREAYGVTLYKCECQPGYVGEHCDIKQDPPKVKTTVDHCDPNPCQNNATCLSTNTTHTCLCPEGFSGRFCEKDPCVTSNFPCVYGNCVQKGSDLSCECFEGYHGDACENEMTDDGGVNQCESSPCSHGGVCVDLQWGYKCNCRSGYSGEKCEETVNECRSFPCRHGGTCVDYINGFKCTCPAGFVGAHCEKNYNDCYPNPCQNDGVCHDGINGFSCQCPRDWSGSVCSERECDEWFVYIYGSCLPIWVIFLSLVFILGVVMVLLTVTFIRCSAYSHEQRKKNQGYKQDLSASVTRLPQA